MDLGEGSEIARHVLGNAEAFNAGKIRPLGKEKFTAYCKLERLIIKCSLPYIGGLQRVIRKCWEDIRCAAFENGLTVAAHCVWGYKVIREDASGGASQLLVQEGQATKKHHLRVSHPTDNEHLRSASTCCT